MHRFKVGDVDNLGSQNQLREFRRQYSVSDVWLWAFDDERITCPACRHLLDRVAHND